MTLHNENYALKQKVEELEESRNYIRDISDRFMQERDDLQSTLDQMRIRVYNLVSLVGSRMNYTSHIDFIGALETRVEALKQSCTEGEKKPTTQKIEVDVCPQCNRVRGETQYFGPFRLKELCKCGAWMRAEYREVDTDG